MSLIIFGIAGSLSQDLQSGIQQFFQLFAQFLVYLMNAPTNAWTSVTQIVGIEISGYGDFVPVMLVIVLGITAITAYTILSISHTIEQGASAESLMEEA